MKMNTDNTAIDTDTEGKRTPHYWKRFIKNAEKAAETHWKDTKNAWREYENKSNSTSINLVSNKDATKRNEYYPIYWASVETLLPAYYSRTPKIVAERTFNINDDTAAVAASIAERLATELIRESNFDDVMQMLVADFIHGSKATAQVAVDVTLKDEEIPLTINEETGEYITPNGEIYDGEVLDSKNGPMGILTNPENPHVYCSPLCFNDVIHTPEARTSNEIKEMAYKFFMSKEEAEERFSPEIIKNIQWKTSKKDSKDEKDNDRIPDILGQYLEGWECWCKPLKKVYWYSDQYPDKFLDVQNDPYKLYGFFPSTPFIISNKPSRTLYPTPSYVQLLPTIRQLHESERRLSRLISMVRRRALVDGDSDLLAALENLEEGEFVAVQNFQNIIEKGGVANMVNYLPVQELVQAMSEVVQLQDKFKNDFYEMFGVPDILRGATDPIETKGAQEIKAGAAHDRFKYHKKLVKRAARDLIEMMVDLALAVYPDEKIQKIAGYQFMSQNEQAQFFEALTILRDDTTRNIRLEIETDSMSFIDQQIAQQQMAYVAQAVNQGLAQISNMLEQSPGYARIGLQILLRTLEMAAPGREFQDEIRHAVQTLINEAENPPEQTPAPDYMLLDLQIKQHKVDMNAALKQQSLQLKAIQQNREMEIKERDLILQQQKIQIEAQKTATEGMLARFDSQLNEIAERFMMQLEAQRLEIEKFKASVNANETLAEESRLAREVELNAQTAVMTAQTEAAKQPPQIPPVDITVNTSDHKNDVDSREIRHIVDDIGNEKIEIAERIPE